MSADTLDAEFREETGSALAVRPAAAVAPWVPTFAVGVDEAVARVEAKRDFFRRVMREGEHYGKIPGTGDKGKPALLKPGAELLLSNMGLRIELTDADAPTVDYGEDGREGLIRYRRVCRVFRQTGTHADEREIVAQAEGSCSSRETKYRYRNDQRKCPECGKPAIIVGKKEYGGGFVCFKKKDGCGATFKDNDPTLVGQVVGKIPNPDLADVENTILKMADKRAVVAAALLATGCSDIFTQDVEEPESAGDPPGDDAPERPVEPSPEAQERRKNLAGKIVRYYALLGLEGPQIASWLSRFSEGRVTDPDRTEDLSKDEMFALGAALKAEYEAQPCPLCTALPGEPHYDDGKGVPCPNDERPEAIAYYANQAERIGDIHALDRQETL